MVPTPLYLDLDDTLIQNSCLLKKDLFRLYSSLGFDEELVASAYQAKALPAASFTPERFLDHLLTVSSAGDPDTTRGTFEHLYGQFARGCSSYLYPDTLHFLDHIDRAKYAPRLLSFGSAPFQEDKLRWTGLLSYFPEESRHIVGGLKHEHLERLQGTDDRFIMVDDKPWIVEAILERFPHSQGILVHPDLARHVPSHPRLTVAENLSDIRI